MSRQIGSVTITHHDSNGTWVVALAGEHDLATAPELDLQTSVVWPRCTVAVVDLTSATFIDLSVITWLVRARRALPATDHEALRVVSGIPESLPSRLLGLTGLSRSLACYSTRRHALAGSTAPDVARQPLIRC